MIRSPGLQVPTARGGATLTEVLMSLLIMSIGIVSVITMFPIAVLRSIQATQLTNSKMMTQNTEQAFRTQFRNPFPPLPADTGPATYLHTDAYEILNYHLNPAVINANEALNTAPQFRGVWRPNTLYHVGHIVTASRSKGTHVTEPGHWMICRGDGGVPPGPGYSGSVEPDWNIMVPYDDVAALTVDGNVTWSAWWDPTPRGAPPIVRRLGGPGAYPSIVPLMDGHTPPTFYGAMNYVLDPLGWATFEADYASVFDNSTAATTPSPSDFGFKYFKAIGLAQSVAPRPTLAPVTNANIPFLLRINGGANTIAKAEALASHPDSWAVEVQTTTLDNLPLPPVLPPYPGLKTAQFPVGTDLSSITPGDCRIVLSSLTSTETYVRDITAANAATLTVGWAEPLPYHFIPDGPARIERRDRRFTWMATVNRDFEGHSRVTVVTFFKRGFKPEEEHSYNANFGNDGTMGLGVPPATYALTGADQIRINWTFTGAAAEPDPLIREGNYVFDGRHATWYRIVAVTRPAAGSAIITVDRPIPRIERTNYTPTGVSPGRCILMRGIVELFEITL